MTETVPALRPGMRPSRLLRATMGLLLLVGLTAGYLVVRPPDSFGAVGGDTQIPAGDGELVVAGIAFPGRTVDLTAVEPVVRGTSDADIKIVRCTLQSSALGVALGADAVADTCTSTTPVMRGRLRPVPESPAGTEQLVAMIRPLKPGTIVIEGFRVTHRSGPFHRTELTGPIITITTR